MMPLPPLLGYITATSQVPVFGQGPGGRGGHIGVSICSIQNTEILGVEKVLACLLAFYTCLKNVDSVGFNNEEACNHHGFIN